MWGFCLKCYDNQNKGCTFGETNKEKDMKATEKNKQAILNVIFERAFELVEKAEEYRGILFPENANYQEIENAALKKAFKEWKENKAVFNKPNFN
jgi:hypothetical protein